MNAVIELEEAYNYYKNDPEFNRELTELFNEYAGRPSRLYYAEKMTRDLGGAKTVSYTHLMNGQTGKMVGDLPVSKGKFWAWFGGIAVSLSAISAVVMKLMGIL